MSPYPEPVVMEVVALTEPEPEPLTAITTTRDSKSAAKTKEPLPSAPLTVWTGSTFRAFANLLKTMVGAGVLTLPHATSKFGLLASVVGIALAGYGTSAAIIFAVRCNAKVCERGSGGDEVGVWERIGRAAYGRLGVVSIISSLLIAQLGLSAAYYDFIVVTIMRHAALSHLHALAVTWVLLTLVSMIRKLSSVAILSLVGLITYIYIIALLVAYSSEALDCSAANASLTADQLQCAAKNGDIAGISPICHPGAAEPIAMATWSGFGAWFGPAVFAFEGMGTAMSIYASIGESMAEDAPPGTSSTVVRRYTDRAFRWVVGGAYSCGVVIYVCVGALGYLAFGSSVEGTILESFPEGPAKANAQIVLAVVLGCTFALQMNPVWGVIEPAILGRGDYSAAWPVLRGVVVALIAIACVLIPAVDAMIALSGAVGFSLLGFILPGLFFLKLNPNASVAVTLDRSVAAGLESMGRAESPGASANGGWGATLRKNALDVVVAIALVAIGCTGSVLGVYDVFQQQQHPDAAIEASLGCSLDE